MVTPLLTGLFLTAAVMLGTAAPAAAAPAYPRPDGRCVDRAGVLGPRLCAKVTKILLRDEARSSDEIAVAVVPSTGAQTIEAWSTGLFNAWGVGKQDKDNGVLLVVAVDDRRVRLETGRGMSSRLSDEAAGEIVRTVITPRFAEGAHAAGILGRPRRGPPPAGPPGARRRPPDHPRRGGAEPPGGAGRGGARPDR
jgi:uncharacterized protein